MKEKLYLFVGVVAFQIGACAIHWGLGFMALGAWFIIGSYIEFDKNYEEDNDNKEGGDE